MHMRRTEHTIRPAIILHVVAIESQPNIIYFMRCRFHTYLQLLRIQHQLSAIRYKSLCAHRCFTEPSLCLCSCVCFFPLLPLFINLIFLLSFGRLFSFQACIRDILNTHTNSVHPLFFSLCVCSHVRVTYSFYDYNM